MKSNGLEKFGFENPVTDFARLRDGRESLPMYMDIDLSTARSITGGTSLILNVAGNSFYVDNDVINCGTAVVHFQDTTLGIASAPFTVTPGFIARVGFTQLLIENAAQAGKRLRIFYGVDIDFQAGISANVSIAGQVAIIDSPSIACQTVVSAGAVALGVTVSTIIAPAANTNGIIVRDIYAASTTGAGASTSRQRLVASTSAPAVFYETKSPAINLLILTVSNWTATSLFGDKEIPMAQRKIPAGFGIYHLVENVNLAGLANSLILTYEAV